MLHLSAFVFLQSAVCFAMGAISSNPFLSSIEGEDKTLFPVTGATRPIIPFTDFGVGLLKDHVEDLDKSLPFPNSTPVPSDSSILPFSEWNRPLTMEYFSHSFIQRIRASKRLRQAFHVQGFNAESLSKFYHDYVYNAHSSIGALDAPVSARVVAEAVTANFDKLEKEDALLRIYANAVADYLFFRGYLNPKNVDFLSQEYFNFTERSVNSIKDPSPVANIKAVADAFTNFLSSLGLVTPYSTVMLCGVFSSRWYLI